MLTACLNVPKDQPSLPYRIVYSLQIGLPSGPGGELRELIVPLKPDGSGVNIEPVQPKERAIDLREGDHFMFQGERESVVGIRAYRDHFTDAEPHPKDSLSLGRACLTLPSVATRYLQ